MYYKNFIKYLTNSIAILIILIGIVFFWLPVPLGALIMGIGVALLLTKSEIASKWLKSLRHRYDRINSILHFVQARLPLAARNVLKKSDPNANTAV